MDQDAIKEMKAKREIKWSSWLPKNLERVEAEAEKHGVPFARMVEYCTMRYLESLEEKR